MALLLAFLKVKTNFDTNCTPLRCIVKMFIIHIHPSDNQDLSCLPVIIL